MLTAYNNINIMENNLACYKIHSQHSIFFSSPNFFPTLLLLLYIRPHLLKTLSAAFKNSIIFTIVQCVLCLIMENDVEIGLNFLNPQFFFFVNSFLCFFFIILLSGLTLFNVFLDFFLAENLTEVNTIGNFTPCRDCIFDFAEILYISCGVPVKLFFLIRLRK